MKIKLKSLSIVFCSIISASLFAASVYAASGISINSVNAQKQQGNYLCWAAVASMAGQYLGKSNATQYNIVAATKGMYMDTAGNVYDAKNGLAAYGVNSIALLSMPTYDNIMYNINTNSNVLAFTSKAGSTIGHAFLIKGYYYNTDNNIQNLYYIDPADASSNVQSFSTFKSNSIYTWVNTVNNIKAN
ncbi:papain-like cysteine protease family protein [Paenibacillus rhizoplanae]|uniref:Papain-like cysteine protease family protein n=1 Tax=Paenibacillus rhizoplanae TaxID=1917181 RepID=A0ABW5FE11_9BACL